MGSPLGGYGGKLGWSAGLGAWLDDPDSKVNRYWRAMEDGSKGDWSGRTVAGLWADTIGNGPLSGSPFENERDQKLRPSFAKGTPQTPEGMLGAARRALWVFMKGENGGKRNWIDGHMDLLRINYVWVYKHQGYGKTRHVIPGSGEMRAPRSQAEYRRAQQSLFHWFMTKAESADEIPFVSGTIVREIKARHYYAKAIEAFKPRLIEMELEGMREAARFALRGVQGSEYARFRGKAANENDTAARRGRARGGVDTLPAKYIPTGGAEVSIAATTQLQFSMRNANGQFINGAFQSTLREVNARVAAAYLREVADLMSFHRPSTGDLIKATLDRRNRYPNDDV